MFNVSQNTYEIEVSWIDEPKTKFHELGWKKGLSEKMFNRKVLLDEKIHKKQNAKSFA